jgi:hypothetical protein
MATKSDARKALRARSIQRCADRKKANAAAQLKREAANIAMRKSAQPTPWEQACALRAECRPAARKSGREQPAQ